MVFLKRIPDQMWIALSFMTRLPVPCREGRVGDAGWGFPVAGAVVGFLSGAILWGALEAGLPPAIAALLAVGASVMLTGALHEDGFADCCDGFWGGATPARRLEIMRDSRCGVFGVLGLVLSTGLRVASLAILVDFWGAQPGWMMLIALHATSRSILPAAMKLMPGADQAGLGSMAGKPGWITVFSALLIALVISGLALNVTPVWMPLVLLASAFLSVGLIGAIARVKLKGINGDTLGGMEQGAEIFCLLAFLSVIGP